MVVISLPYGIGINIEYPGLTVKKDAPVLMKCLKTEKCI